MSAERLLSVDMAAAIAASVVRPVLFFEGEFATGTGRWWTGFGSFEWDGHSWGGLGGLVRMSPIDETTSVTAQGFSVDLSGQNPEHLALALGACRQGKRGRVWLGMMTEAGALIADPYLLREGKLDVAGGADDGESATITVTYEDRLIDLERPREYRYTTESQRLFYPGDLGFEFVPSLQDTFDVWKAAR